MRVPKISFHSSICVLLDEKCNICTTVFKIFREDVLTNLSDSLQQNHRQNILQYNHTFPEDIMHVEHDCTVH